MTEHATKQAKSIDVSDVSPAHDAGISLTSVPPLLLEKSKTPSLENNKSFDSI